MRGSALSRAFCMFEKRMRLSALALGLALVIPLAACNAGRSAMDGARQFGAGVGAAATAPLDDLNLRRVYIPTVLLQAEALCAGWAA